MITGRFAPSPTGALHLGHAWSAIQAHDRVRADDGCFLLRIEDIDGTRSRPEHVQGILDDLDWLGIGWDGAVTFQSERVPLYADALDILQASGHVYRCFCTRSEIEAHIAASGSAPHGDDVVPAHPESCRHRDEREIAERLSRDEPFAWRLDMAAAFAPHVGIGWEDEIAGPQTANPLPAGDVVLWRKDAPASYHLAVTVDDAAQGVTHIVRGRDLFEATHVHRLLQAMLGLPVPTYRHHALLTDTNGHRLAKRHGAPTLADLRADYPDGRVLADRLRAGDLPIGFAVGRA